MTVSWHTDVRILKFSFFQRLIVIELLVSETMVRKSKPVTMFGKTDVNKDFVNLKDKSLIRIKNCNPSYDFQKFSEKFYKSKCGHEVIKILNIEATALRYYGK